MHINQQDVPPALALASSSLIYVSAGVKVLQAPLRGEAGRPSASSHDGWPLIRLGRRAAARDQGSRKFFGSRVKPRATFASLYSPPAA